ncbi:MAG: hypothetical protein HPY44_15875 [Armatimonadetes bacterium]|nr:hypothetical protein [Armatimonadota bacterium]
MAHLLIIDAKDFERELAGNPFYILDGGFAFASEIEDAIERREKARDSVKLPVELTRDLGSEDIKLWDETDATSRKALAHLAVCEHWPHAVDDRGEPKPEAIRAEFLGTPGEIEATLRGIFALLSAEIRMTCTFNTGAARTTLPEFGLWACGLRQKEPKQERVARVDCAARSVEGVPQTASIPENYGLWLVDRVDTNATFTHVLSERTDAVKAFRLVDGKGEGYSDSDDWSLIESVIGTDGAGRSEVRARIVARAATRIMSLKPPRLDQKTIEQHLDMGLRKVLALLHGPASGLNDFCMELRVKQGGEFGRRDIGDWERIVAGLGDSHRMKVLREAFLAARDPRRKRVRLAQSLKDQVEQEGVDGYGKTAKDIWRLRLADPAQLYVPGYAAVLLDEVGADLTEPRNHERLCALIREILKAAPRAPSRVADLSALQALRTVDWHSVVGLLAVRELYDLENTETTFELREAVKERLGRVRTFVGGLVLALAAVPVATCLRRFLLTEDVGSSRLFGNLPRPQAAFILEAATLLFSLCIALIVWVLRGPNIGDTAMSLALDVGESLRSVRDDFSGWVTGLFSSRSRGKGA